MLIKYSVIFKVLRLIIEGFYRPHRAVAQVLLDMNTGNTTFKNNIYITPCIVSHGGFAVEALKHTLLCILVCKEPAIKIIALQYSQ